MLNYLCTYNADYAVVPAFTLNYNNPVVKNVRLFGIELINLCGYILLKFLAAVVLLAKVAGKLRGSSSVVKSSVT